MKRFIGHWDDWKIVEILSFIEKLGKMNRRQQPAYALYLYGDLTYYTIHSIIAFYKNYFGKPWTFTQKKFNKAMSRLRIKVEYHFTIYHNFWFWNNFYLGLKICQKVAIRYSVLVFLSNI